ncbi:MAG: sulfatase [Planctomycetales bacterium]|nr:sulfatase [Planctomycetales bacterium]
MSRNFKFSVLTVVQALCWLCVPIDSCQAEERPRYNVLFIIADDLTSTALSCYGNTVCKTPNIDALAARGMRFTHAYCQGTYCGPSRASFMSGYYPHAVGELGYKNPRPLIGDRETWSQAFKNQGYYAARVSKIFHMGVPGGIEIGGDGRDHDGGNGADDELSWTERFNSPGPEWRALGDGETLEGNPDGKLPVKGGNTFVVVEADGDDSVHSDGRTAQTAIELLRQRRIANENHQNASDSGVPFWLGVGFVRPHVPFVAPRKYFENIKPYDGLTLPAKVENDWDDIPSSGINYKTSRNMQMDLRRQRKALGGYFAAVQFMDAQVGKVLAELASSKLADNTIVVFTSDHGYHLGEHDFWAKVSLHEESASVPLIISVPGKASGVSDSLVELLDLFPTTLSLCGLPIPERLQGKDLSAILDDPQQEVREAAFSVSPMQRGFLMREKRWAYIQYEEDGSGGAELFDMQSDPQQFTNLVHDPRFEHEVERLKQKMAIKLRELRTNDLPLR